MNIWHARLTHCKVEKVLLTLTKKFVINIYHLSPVKSTKSSNDASEEDS
jgi:hypothetical protein